MIQPKTQEMFDTLKGRNVIVLVSEVMSVVCPKCNAAIGAKCLERDKNGSHWIETFHQMRFEKANEA